MTTLDKWDRFLYLRMMFANGFRSADNIRTIISKEFKSFDNSLNQISKALEIMKKSLEVNKKETSDSTKYPSYEKVKPIKSFEKDDLFEEQRAGINYYNDGS
jgi:hypothetical protein